MEIIKGLSQKFYETNVNVIVDKNRKEWFNLHDIGISLGYVRKNSYGVYYLRKGRFNKLVDSNKDEIEIKIFNEERYVDEQSVYLLCLASRTEKGKEFRRWIVSDLLPTIRKKYVDKVSEMFSKEHQKSMMDKIHELETTDKRTYAIVNRMVNSIVSEIYQLDKPINKDEMMEHSRDMYRDREKILSEFISILEISGEKSFANMTMRKKYKLPQQGKYKNFKF